jgi:signal transduction histidine kinase
MPSEQHAEVILLESSEDHNQQPTEETFTRVTAQLAQVQKWKHISIGSRILDNRFLYVKKYFKRKTTAYWVNLLFLDPVPQQERQIDWRWAVAAFALLALSSSLVVVEYSFDLSAKFAYFNSISVLLATASIVSILALIYTARNSVFFTTLHGRTPVVSFINNQPSKDVFQAYVKTLGLCIEKVQTQNARNSTNRLANELAEHRRLKKEKIISAQEYEEAKNRILSQH